jgi:3-methyladenine DNA glycosylase AlkD
MDRARTRGLCDGVADLLGHLVMKDRVWCRVLRNWALSKDPWMRRASAAAVWRRARQMGDAEAAFEAAEPLMRDAAPEVQEAVAALLDFAREADPDGWRRFVGRWEGKASAPILSSARR